MLPSNEVSKKQRGSQSNENTDHLDDHTSHTPDVDRSSVSSESLRAVLLDSDPSGAHLGRLQKEKGNLSTISLSAISWSETECNSRTSSKLSPQNAI